MVMPEHQGVGHIMLTVTDPNKSAEFYNRVFGTQTLQAGEDELGPVAICVGPNLIVGFRKHKKTGKKDAFDFTRVGLDHVAVHVSDRSELEKWRAHLDENGVKNSGIVEDPFGLHLNAKDPDNIALEFLVPPQQS
jgi:glyoxylase I family protein